MFNHILLPVDLTDKNEVAVAAAPELVTEDGRVFLLHVIETIADAPFEDMQDFYQRLEEKARTAMGKLANTLDRSGLTVEPHVIYGRRAAQIVSFADDNQIDLIVMSSRSFDPDRPESVWASISHQVAVLARCPVLLLK